MNITELRYLVAIMKWGSVSAAAKQLYAAQPNVSKALKNLEEEYHLRILWGYVPAAVPRYLKERKVFSAATGNVLLLFGKITVSFPARKNLSQSLWQRLF